MITTTLTLDGLHCASCAVNIDDELESLPGVAKSATSYARSTCVVTYDTSFLTASRLIEAISSLGYQVKSST